MQVNVRIFAPKYHNQLHNQISFNLNVLGKKTLEETTENKISSIENAVIDFKGHRFYDFAYAVTNSKLGDYKLVTLQL